MVYNENPFHGPSGEPGEMVHVKCVYCYGRGTDPFGLPAPESNCLVCRGKGYNRVLTPYIVCATCNGTGKMPGQRMTCTACKGKGVRMVRSPMVSCPQCRGTGRQPGVEHNLPCTFCAGRGMVEQKQTSAPRPTAKAARPAPTPPPSPSPVDRSAPARPAPPPPARAVSVADRIAAYVTNCPGVRPVDIQVFFGLSPDDADSTLGALVQARRIRQKEDDLYYPT